MTKSSILGEIIYMNPTSNGPTVEIHTINNKTGLFILTTQYSLDSSFKLTKCLNAVFNTFTVFFFIFLSGVKLPSHGEGRA